MMRQEDLKGLRLAKGLKQAEIAEMVDVNVRTYRRWENSESETNRDMMRKLWPILNEVVL